MEDSEASNLDGKESIIELKVTYGRERDILRVKNTLQRLPWYKERRYDISLPRGISQNSTQEEIVAVVQTGYREEEYKDFEIFIKDKWKDFSQKFEDLKNIPSLNLRGTYTLILTKYGVGASYDAEKREVTVNIIYRGKEKIMGTIFHEIVHMTIQHLVEKYQIKHWQKERLVDLMMEKYFPKMTNMQNIKEDVTTVDEAFNKFFPDFEAITRALVLRTS